MTAEPIGFPTHQLSAWRRYGARWRRIGKEIVAIVLLFFTAVIGFSVCLALVPAGIGLLPLFPVGVFLLAAGLCVALATGAADLRLLEWVGLPRIQRSVRSSRPGFAGWLRSTLGSARNWAMVGYVVLPQFALAAVSFIVLTTLIGIGAGGVSWTFWRSSVHGGNVGLEWLLHRWPGADQPALEGIIYVMLGLAFLAVLPYVTRGLLWAQWQLARTMLGDSQRRADAH
ncbi:sensor domain-containing protein [Humibacter albus]|uniref:sensor domain-containing protein n=1 Tax=Humibacter albus TaxID=427754 RepID=UPI0003B3ACF6|nr:sensor domain-containing protein [Humibacter albus]